MRLPACRGAVPRGLLRESFVSIIQAIKWQDLGAKSLQFDSTFAKIRFHWCRLPLHEVCRSRSAATRTALSIVVVEAKKPVTALLTINVLAMRLDLGAEDDWLGQMSGPYWVRGNRAECIGHRGISPSSERCIRADSRTRRDMGLAFAPLPKRKSRNSS